MKPYFSWDPGEESQLRLSIKWRITTVTFKAFSRRFDARRAIKAQTTSTRKRTRGGNLSRASC